LIGHKSDPGKHILQRCRPVTVYEHLYEVLSNLQMRATHTIYIKFALSDDVQCDFVLLT